MSLRAPLFLPIAAFFISIPLHADQVIMKDGTVYTGKIQIDNGKAILIGNPPFDPTAYLLENKDIDKVIYEEYKRPSPAKSRRGLQVEARVNGDVFSSDQLPLRSASSLYVGAGLRVHPLLELNGGFDWMPALYSNRGLSIATNTTPTQNRSYQDFQMLRGIFAARLYPFYKKMWKVEPYATAGYSWARLLPPGSGDSLKGEGWLAGVGALYPLTTHLFLEGRFAYESLSFDTMNFLGQEANLEPAIDEKNYTFSLGMSWRM